MVVVDLLLPLMASQERTLTQKGPCLHVQYYVDQINSHLVERLGREVSNKEKWDSVVIFRWLLTW